MTLLSSNFIQTTIGFIDIWNFTQDHELVLANGSTCLVSEIVESSQESFKVTFKDERSAELGSDQLLRVFQHSWLPETTKWRVHPLRTVIKTYPNRISKLGLREQRDQRHIQLVEPFSGGDVALPLHPYLLGALLGDGSLSRSTTFTSADPELVEELNSVMPDGVVMVKLSSDYGYGIRRVVKKGSSGLNTVNQVILDLGLRGLVSNNKFIPESYLRGSSYQRAALLQGLMDTDGTADIQKTCSFCSVSKLLAEQVQYLVRSLGGLARIATKTPTYTYLGEKKVGQLAYQVNIRMKDSTVLFRLPRKLQRVGGGNQYSNRLRLEIKSIEPIGLRKVRSLVLPVESPIYVLGDFIAVHGISNA